MERWKCLEEEHRRYSEEREFRIAWRAGGVEELDKWRKGMKEEVR